MKTLNFPAHIVEKQACDTLVFSLAKFMFCLDLRYQDNGNISSVSWATKDVSGGMGLAYDGANRLTSATGTGGFADCNESISSYDANGNIKNLSRSFGGTPTNQLTYSYTGNQLTQVEDSQNNADPTKGFVGVASHTAGEMAYDANGNLKKDLNRGITDGGLSYNVLNLPATVSTSSGVARYVYDSGGQKRQRTDPTGSTLYEGAFEYKSDGTLLRVGLEEGQLLRDPVTGLYTVQYYLVDHLGNVRQVLNEDQSVVQQSEYYAFGLSIARQLGANRYLYNGLEKQAVTDTYLAKYRGLDPTLGRWLQIDPKPTESMSLYAAMQNSPLRYADPLGDTIFVNSRGTVVRNTGGDYLVYQQGRKGDAKAIGELGKKVDINNIYKNILSASTKEAKGIYSYSTFRDNVKTNGKWDLKNDKNSIFGLGNDGKTKFTFQGKSLGSQDVGNHHFGVVALASGLFTPFGGEDFILKQAGEYQIKSGTSKPEWQIYDYQSIGVDGIISVSRPPYGDDPQDQSFIKQGFEYFKANQANE